MSIHTHNSRAPHRHHDVTSSRNRSLEFETTRAMNPSPLQNLHGAMIEVVLKIGGTSRSVRGEGQFDIDDADLGQVLRVLVADGAGDFELLIPASTWDGFCESSSLPECKFRISLPSTLPCAN